MMCNWDYPNLDHRLKDNRFQPLLVPLLWAKSQLSEALVGFQLFAVPGINKQKRNIALIR